VNNSNQNLLREFLSYTINKHQDNLPQNIIKIKNNNGIERKIIVSICKTQEQISKGLMFRETKLPDNEGMLFCMNESKIHSFWMKNTYIPLDMIFINKKGRIVGILENVEPFSLNSRFVNEKSYFVLEVNSGWCKNNDITKGNLITF
jgi:uncharacterized membrane protein (UPF0127 family)